MKHILILATALNLVACNNAKQEETVESKPETTIETKTEITEGAENTSATSETDAVSGATDVANSPSFNGILIVPPQQQATVTLSIGGIVKNTSLLVGQYVKKGETIAVLDNPEFIDLQQEYLDASAQLEYLEKEYTRQQNLASQEAASQKRLQQSKAEYLSVKSKAEAMSSKLSLLGIDINAIRESGLITRLEVKAPISGYITNTNINIGKYLNPGEPICDIIDKSNMMLQLTAYEKDLADIEIGDTVEFLVNGMGIKTFEAELISIDQKVDNDNRSIKVFARLKETAALFRPGMYVSAKIKEKQ